FSFTALPGFPADLNVNQTWLYNLLCYVLYSLLGGAGLVLVKALVVAALAVLLLRLCRVDHGAWIAAACTALALLAMSTRLLLQPATFSYLLLGLTLWCLYHPRSRRTHWLHFLIPPWPLLLLFLVWTNLDRWVVVGLGTVLLFWVGRAIDDWKEHSIRPGTSF